MPMTNKLILPVESRMQGDLHVRFGGRLWETYHRKVVRRPLPSLLASGSYCSSLEFCLFSPVLHDGDDALHIYGAVIRLVVDLRISQRAVVPQGLQRAWADVEHPAHVLIVHPLAHCLLSVPLADGFHAADEAVELGDHRLKGLSFD